MTIKAYTDLPQSKILAEILPLESYDMYWDLFDTAGRNYTPHLGRSISIDRNFLSFQNGDVVPAWSLAALLSVIPEVSLNTFKDGKWNAMIQHDGKMIYSDTDNPVDACYELILKLNELKMLWL